MATNITYHASTNLSHSDRSQILKSPGLTIWLTGLSASGKSTIACALEHYLLTSRKIPAYRLDGDNIRFGLNSDLGFSEKDRTENIRRISEVARLFADSCSVAITAFISPYRKDRDLARKIHEDALLKEAGHGGEIGDGTDEGKSETGKTMKRKGLGFVEVWIDCPVNVAETRDPKGLYKKARAGEIKEFTGISAPYEEPKHAEIHIRTDQTSVDEAVKMIVDYLDANGLLSM